MHILQVIRLTIGAYVYRYIMTHEIRMHATENSSFSDMDGNENTDF